MRTLLGLLCGALFGAGLEIAGMTNPWKIQNFLDVFGTWDPSLAFVMGAALVFSVVSVVIAKRRERSWLGDVICWPSRHEFDARLFVGAALFGVGWGLAGFCPGPAIANLHRADPDVLIFVTAMAVGMGLHSMWENAHAESASDPAPSA